MELLPEPVGAPPRTPLGLRPRSRSGGDLGAGATAGSGVEPQRDLLQIPSGVRAERPPLWLRDWIPLENLCDRNPTPDVPSVY